MRELEETDGMSQTVRGSKAVVTQPGFCFDWGDNREINALLQARERAIGPELRREG